MTGPMGLARAGLVVSGAFLVSRVLGWVRLVVIGRAFEPAQLDTFFAAFRIPDLIFQLVAAGALSSALIPIVSALLEREEQARAWRVVSTVINVMLIALASLAAVLFLLAPVVMRAITPGFDGEQLERTIVLTRIMLLSPIFLAMGAVASSVLNAGGRFAASAVAPIVYNLAIIGGALFLAPTFGVEGVALGVVAGSLGHLLVQVRPLSRLGFRYEARIDRDDPQARRALALMVPRAFGLGASQVTFIVVTALASTLAVGAVADFNIAFTLLQIPIGVIGVPLGIVLLPSLSRDAAVGRETEFARLLTRALRLLLFAMIPIAGLAAVLRRELVDILFGGGKIGEADLGRIATTLLWFLTGLAAHALIAVLARAFYARQDTLTPVLAAIAAVVRNTTLAIVLVGPLGLSGIALAIALAAWVEAFVLLVILRWRIRELRLASLARVAVQAAVGTVVGSALAFGTNALIGRAIEPDPSALSLILDVGAATAVFGLAYAAVSVVLRIPELASIVEVMVDLIRRPLRS
ncbi:MAG: murein biosynthesis integral membrane protein MurJ [Candidatus Limnocylindrales bacterium]|nr:murein biosynthesis integral membrane protein MurJ [Candidatus Limnocylindrales bacterium]